MKAKATDDMRPEYDFSKGQRGRYAGRRIVILGAISKQNANPSPVKCDHRKTNPATVGLSIKSNGRSLAKQELPAEVCDRCGEVPISRSTPAPAKKPRRRAS